VTGEEGGGHRKNDPSDISAGEASHDPRILPVVSESALPRKNIRLKNTPKSAKIMSFPAAVHMQEEGEL
jgi:hypothetical protein